MVYFRSKPGQIQNFDNVAAPPKDRLKHSILDLRDMILTEMLRIETRKGRGLSYPIHRLRACLITLYSSIHTSIQYSLTKEIYAELKAKVHGKTYQELREGWQLLDEFLYKKNLIAFDTGQNIDFNDMEAENESKGQ